MSDEQTKDIIARKIERAKFYKGRTTRLMPPIPHETKIQKEVRRSPRTADFLEQAYEEDPDLFED